MIKIKNILIFIFIAIPICSLLYKSNVSHVKILPEAPTDTWRLELKFDDSKKNTNDNNSSELADFNLPKPHSSQSQEITDLIVEPEQNKVKEGKPARILDLSAQVRLFGQLEPKRKYRQRLSARQAQKYLQLPELSTKTLEELKNIRGSIVFDNDTAIDKVKKIFYFISDELILQPTNSQLTDVLALKSGSYLGQARLLSALAILDRIPARIAFGVQILEPNNKNTNRYIRVFYSEVFIGGSWIPINPHQKEFGVIKNNFIVIDNDSEGLADIYNNRDLFSIYVKPQTFGQFNSENYIKKFEQKAPFWSAISLHNFPLSIQSIFFGLLLIPFGTVILSFMRVVVGVETFGIFTPILLTLFFLETSLLFGLSFFVIVVLLGLSQRALLDKFYLLAVPRLSVLLAFVIFLYTVFAIIMEHFGFLKTGQDSLSYFPIVIITVFIERFSIHFIEEGAVNTLKTTLGTFAVSILCYLLLSVVWLKSLLFNNPELLFLAIGLNLLLGSYKGYRALEFVRFADLRKS